MIERVNVIKTTSEESKKIIVSSSGHTFQKLDYDQILEEKKSKKPLIGMRALSRSNMRTDGESDEEESKEGQKSP